MKESLSQSKDIHFIGICGVAMSALAIAFKEKGWKVSGSDVGFYPPVSTHLTDAGIAYYPGWHPEKMGRPDVVVVGNVAGSENPEWLFAREHNLNIKSYPEIVGEFFVRKNSIVTAGTYGKTTTAALLAWIFKEAGRDPSYMFGGIVQPITPSNLPLQGGGQGSETVSPIHFPSAHIGNGKYSILEGDEYKSARWDARPKFAHYSPTHLLLTSVQWDHADVYPTEARYFDAFFKLAESVPNNGRIVANANDQKVREIAQSSACPIITYGSTGADYAFSDITQTKTATSFTLSHDGLSFYISSPMLGAYQAANIAGAFALAYETGIEPDIILRAISEFPGIKRRLEKRYEDAITIFDDIAHSPAKASSVLKTLRALYSGKIVAVFEPNTGNRKPESTPSYDRAFQDADEVIIPRLTKIKQDAASPSWNCEQLVCVISKTHNNARHIHEDDALIEYIARNTKKDDVVVFLGSHGFRGMIEALVTSLHQKYHC